MVDGVHSIWLPGWFFISIANSYSILWYSWAAFIKSSYCSGRPLKKLLLH